MQEQDLLQMLQPIKEYINKNEVRENDIPEIVLKFFPLPEKILEISKYLQLHLPSFRELSDDKMLRRTKQVLANALNEAAFAAYQVKVGTPKFSKEEIDEELCNYEWDEEYTDGDFNNDV